MARHDGGKAHLPPAVLLTVYGLMMAAGALLTDLCLRRWTLTAGLAGALRPWWLLPFVLLALIPVAGAFWPGDRLRFALQAAGNIWLGFYLYYVGILAALCAVSAWAGWDMGWALGLSAAAALGLMVCGMAQARRIVVRRWELKVDKRAGGAESMKLALIADLHLGVNSRLADVERMVALVNAEQPDAVLVGGDVFTSSYGGLRRPEAYAKALRGLKARYGVFAVYGNHDVEEPLFGGFPITPPSRARHTPQIMGFFRDCGFQTLRDEVVTLGGAVQLAGRLDGDKAGDGTANRMTPEALLAGTDRSLPIVVLQHEPKEFKALAEAGADVVLCGHTHAGQLFPGSLVVPFFNENARGHARVHGIDTVVTAGVGCYGPPMRVGVDSEVTVVKLRFQ